jgi:acetoin:2,6-dichlorophenolindophenol oxidoreductase subunit beta
MAYLSSGQATNQAMRLVMQVDPTVICMGLDIRWGGSFGQFRGLYDEFPDRILDMPISEALIVSAAVGAAATGLRPVVSMSFVEFLLGAMDELVNQASKLRYMFGGQATVPVVIRCADGVIRSAAAQHSESLEALFAHIPGLKVVAPSNAYDSKGLLIAAIGDDNPVVFLENKRVQPRKSEVPDDIYEVPLGVAKVIRSGRDLTIVSYSMMALNALEAAEQLAADGIDAEVIDLRTLVPLDTATIEASVQKTGRALICHEAWTFGGFGAEVAAQISDRMFGYLRAPVRRVGARHSHIPFAPGLEGAVVPNADDIRLAARQLVESEELRSADAHA